ncbi:MAG: N-acetyl-gamma-glutamyl-phosphate reductase [Chthonomonadales bacterium]|nr:N-acetyl-gamma-glutamyl-phosphate reductase [Chthonomonadales bacterium]
MQDVAIIGASGYGGGELLRWLAVHPQARVALATSRTHAGKPVSAAFPGLAGRMDLTLAAEAAPDQMARCAVVFLARDNGAAMDMAPGLLAAGCRVVDLSADFRFRDPAHYEAWYGAAHRSPQLTRGAAYGMPELHRDAIRVARVVGNPGCYTSASILALAPLVEAGLVELDSIVVDGKSGLSGAGRSKFGLDYHFAEANESVWAYKIAGTHRHTPEIEQELSALAGQSVTISFTPCVVPMTRGILASAYARLSEYRSADALRELYRAFYRDAPFVWVSDDLPATKHTLGSNMCHIGLGVDARTNRVTVLAALDNLGKGMAGQAVQNMNLMCGWDETAGLGAPPLWP